MKKALFTALTFSLLLTAFAAPKRYKLLSSTANWSNKNNWSPTGLPNTGDTVYIPENVQLTLSNDLTLESIYFDLYGSLILSGNNMKMLLQKNSTLNVHTSGWIDGSKASQQIVLGSIIFKGDHPVITGPKLATVSTDQFVPYQEFVILPVTFTSFSVAQSHNNCLVQWTTTDEVNAAYYEVQRSVDGASWKASSVVFATGNTTNRYSYNDKTSTSGTVYYRIKQVDADGTFTYTVIRTLKNEMVVMPTIKAFQNKIAIELPQQVNGKVSVAIIGLNGNILSTQYFAEPAGNIQMVTPLKGIYMVRVSNGKDLNFAKQVLL